MVVVFSNDNSSQTRTEGFSEVNLNVYEEGQPMTPNPTPPSNTSTGKGETEGNITLFKFRKGYIIHLSQQLGFSSEIALTNKEVKDLKKLLEDVDESNQ